ncbi:MAG: GNAT family N-acetyltransferase, partial [Deltaproteobacteria bacterium]|nr:GNAT family N-acetyltransferase [Deltaproteobacteria bacterium]
MKIDITEFLEADYNEAILLWKQIEEVGLDDADSFENTCSFLKRNQGMSFVARHKG